MKKSEIVFVFIFGMASVLALPAYADSTILYNNTTSSSYKGNSDYVGGGTSVTDSFSLSANATITGISLGVELMGGALDPVTEVGWQVTTAPFGGSQIDSGVATSFTEIDFASVLGPGDSGFIAPAQITFDIDDPEILANTTYYLEIDNLAGTLYGSPAQVNWDVSGGSSASTISDFGSAPSNTFQILGAEDSSTPEPSSFLLLGSGLAGLAGLIKRKLTTIDTN
ncbi:MAG TPA: PEP-CTERM sorting domain-containing protein [Terracidiphilus sp.]